MSTSVQADLLEEIQKVKKDVATDSLSMSIGELVSLYESGDIILRPEFQRQFRWKEEQKVKLIESLLVGIPIPNISVFQDQEGKWEVVDGLQRLSTIFQFMGKLKGEDGRVFLPFEMTSTKYLKSIAGFTWETGEKSFSDILKRDFRRIPIRVVIISRVSGDAKYDLFDRLNSGGSLSTSQEVRSAMIYAKSRELQQRLEELSRYPSFEVLTQVSDNIEDTQRFVNQGYLDLVCRFIAYRNVDFISLREKNANSYIDDYMILLADGYSRDKSKFETDENIFKGVFDFLLERIGPGVFQQYSVKNKRFQGAFAPSYFEIFGIGLAKDDVYGPISQIDDKVDLYGEVVKFWKKEPNMSEQWRGRSTSNRLQITVSKGRDFYRQLY